MTAEMLARLEGETEPVPASELSWACIAPCGCTVGCRVVDTLDPETAGREMWDTREQYDRHIEDGYTMRLERRDAVMERMLAREKCSHDRPDIVTVPAGHLWAERDGSRRRHLVPSAELRVIDEKRDLWLIHGRTAALCESKPPDRYRPSWEKPSWSTGHPTCRRCEAKARDLAAEKEATR